MPQQPPVKLHLPQIPGALDPTGRFTPLMEARHLQRLIFTQSTAKKITPLGLSHLARAWCAVQECIRVMRGIPSPGQLRPDLDPQQLQKALKRARSRKPMIDIATGPFELPSEGPAPTPASKLPQPEPGKGSLGLTAPAKTPQGKQDPPQQTIATTKPTPDPEPQNEGKGIS